MLRTSTVCCTFQHDYIYSRKEEILIIVVYLTEERERETHILKNQIRKQYGFLSFLFHLHCCVCPCPPFSNTLNACCCWSPVKSTFIRLSLSFSPQWKPFLQFILLVVKYYYSITYYINGKP